MLKKIDFNKIDELNKKYRDLDFRSRIVELYGDFEMHKILLTSSFGSTSIVLIHLFNSINPDQPVHFIDTSYHFPETKEYITQLIEKFNLNVKVVKAGERENEFTRKNQIWKYNPNLCCFINKVDPVDKIKPDFDVWVSGLLGFQNGFRNGLKIFEKKIDIIKFHPLIDLSREDIAQYISIYDLPVHPLVFKGYDSIGCTHCTKKGNGRKGRWLNSVKTECGLHDR